MPAPADDSRPVAIAVVGLGKMGIMHATMLRTLPGARVAALVDNDAATARNVRSMGFNAPVFDSLETCLRAVQPDGVVVATPQFAHRPLVQMCIEQGVPVFTEKPMAHTLEDARAMAEAARRRPDLPVAVGYQTAHNPLYARAARLLRTGAIGTAKSFTATCRLSQVFSPKKGWTFSKEGAGGGVLINSGCHLIHTLTMLFGKPRAVCARATPIHNEVEDTFGALLDHGDGLWGMMQVTWSVPGHELQTNDIEVIGTAGTLRVNNDELRLWLAREYLGRPAGWTVWRREEVEPRSPFTLSPEYCGDEFWLQMKDFADAIRERRTPRVGFDAALGTQEILAALYDSARDGRPVALGAAAAVDVR